MSRAAKAFFAFSVLASGGTIYGVHYIQTQERIVRRLAQRAAPRSRSLITQFPDHVRGRPPRRRATQSQGHPARPRSRIRRSGAQTSPSRKHPGRVQPRHAPDAVSRRYSPHHRRDRFWLQGLREITPLFVDYSQSPFSRLPLTRSRLSSAVLYHHASPFGYKCCYQNRTFFNTTRFASLFAFPCSPGDLSAKNQVSVEKIDGFALCFLRKCQLASNDARWPRTSGDSSRGSAPSSAASSGTATATATTATETETEEVLPNRRLRSARAGSRRPRRQLRESRPVPVPFQPFSSQRESSRDENKQNCADDDRHCANYALPDHRTRPHHRATHHHRPR